MNITLNESNYGPACVCPWWGLIHEAIFTCVTAQSCLGGGMYTKSYEFKRFPCVHAPWSVCILRSLWTVRTKMQVPILMIPVAIGKKHTN